MILQEKIKSMLLKNSRLMIHVVIWAVLTIGFWILSLGRWHSFDAGEKLLFSLGYLLFPAVFYLNTYRIMPFFRRLNKSFIYSVFLFLLLFLLEINKGAIFSALQSLLNTNFNFNRFVLDYLQGPLALGVVSSLGYSIVKFLNEYPRLVNRLKAEKTSLELAFLKSQTDPHFLFNTLNSIYALALEENGPRTADGIAKLGTLMRYNLHDSQFELISLSKEIDYIKTYIELQKLRATGRNRLELNIDITAEAAETARIAPMLLIPFVENAFKFSISPTEESSISIDMLLAGNTFRMQVRNSILRKTKPGERSGVGLQNVRKRLELLYPHKYLLSAEEGDNLFYVDLEVRIGSSPAATSGLTDQ